MESTEHGSDAAQRSRDVDLRGVLLTGFWLAVGTIASAAFIGGLLWFLGRSPNQADKRLSSLVAANLQRTPPAPRLEANPVEPRVGCRPRGLGSPAMWVDEREWCAFRSIGRWTLMAERGLPPSSRWRPAPAAPEETRGAPAVVLGLLPRRLPERRTARPPMLKDVGIDQHLGQPQPLDAIFRTRPATPPGPVLRRPPGDPRARLLQLSDALHPGLQRPHVVPARAVLRRGQGVRGGRGQLRPERPAGRRSREEKTLCRQYGRPAPRRGIS